MKKLIILSIVAFFVSWSLYKAQADTLQNAYTCTDVSVTSASTPVNVLSPKRITTWFAHVEASPAADPVRLFFYTGSTVPTAVPSPAAYMEVTSGSNLSDTVACTAPSCADAIGQGIGAYLGGGSTATTLDICTR